VRKYALKIVIDIEATDDVEARKSASAILTRELKDVPGKRESVLHSMDDRKSIRFSPAGECLGQWSKQG
jgi:hypothetical protein